jgi:hypothetical protein
MEGSLVAYKVFSNGSVLQASEINDNLMRQSVMVFSNAAARTAAITTPLEGMLTWLEDVNAYEFYSGTSWKSAALGMGSGLVPINSTTITALASQSFNNVFSSDYENYFVMCDFSRSTASNINFRMRSAGTDETGNNYIQQNFRFSSTSGTGSSSTGNFGFINTQSGSTQFYGFINIYKPFLATKSNFISNEHTTTPTIGAIATEHQLTNAYDGFTLIASAGTITGTVRIYGYRN